MKYYNSICNCLNCNYAVDDAVLKHSTSEFGVILCFDCQGIFRATKIKLATPEAKKLFFALKRRGAPVKIETNTRIGRIDITIIRERINIEVDGGHHKTKASQALTDLRRIRDSLQSGYQTLHIPNSAIEKNLDETADLIIEILNNNQAIQRKRA